MEKGEKGGNEPVKNLTRKGTIINENFIKNMKRKRKLQLKSRKSTVELEEMEKVGFIICSKLPIFHIIEILTSDLKKVKM